MKAIAARFWADDHGAIISVEWVLFVAITIFGLTVGFAALRNQVNAAIATVGNALLAILPNFTYSGFGLGATGGDDIARVGGVELSTLPDTQLTSFAVTPSPITFLQVDPSP